MIKKILQWVALAICLTGLITFSILQFQQSKDQKQSQENSVTEAICSSDCSNCPSKETCQKNSDNTFKEVTHNEFKEVSEDEFQETSTSDEVTGATQKKTEKEIVTSEKDDSKESDAEKVQSLDISLYYSLLTSLFIFLTSFCIIGFLFKSLKLQPFRPLILLSSLVYWGFIMGGCPCIISHFQNSILFLTGNSTFWIAPAFLLALALLTILFGKIFCGWLCQLGALQEFIFKGERFKFLTSQRSQKILRWFQISMALLLIVITLFKQTLFYCQIDPFRLTFNLMANNTLEIILVIVLLLSCLFIYRPFCRAFCPVGLLLSWTSKLPFSTKIAITNDCISCGSCHKRCPQQALHDKKRNDSCIMCGKCLEGGCKKNCLIIK
ncbi:MAG: 4Fe-4S binding protein [Bacteroidales bacterium]